MSLKSIVFTIRDIKRILDNPSKPGLTRGSLARTYARLKLLTFSKSIEKRSTKILDYNVNYFDATNLYMLYQDIFLGRIYQAKLDNTGPFIIDCGSNIGMAILFFKSQYPDAKIIGFEPHPSLYQILEENVGANKLTDVTIKQKALSESAGSIDFYLNEDNPGSLNMGLIQRKGASGSISVDTELLSNYITDRVDLLKLDIEGAEEGVLRDLQQHDKLRYVNQIICEYHHHIDTGIDRLSTTLQMLESAGFGYQLLAYSNHPPVLGAYQDVMIYAFNKEMAGTSDS